MKLKFSLSVAALMVLTAGLPITVSAQETQPSAGTDAPAPDSMPQSAPSLENRSGSWRRAGGKGGGMREKMRGRMMERYDANHDGTLDDSERAAMRAAKEQRMQQRGAGGQLGGPGNMGAGQRHGRGMGMSDEQRQARKQKMLERFDANHDGKIDEAERSQIREQMGKMRGGGKHHRRAKRGSDIVTPAPDSAGNSQPAAPAN